MSTEPVPPLAGWVFADMNDLGFPSVEDLEQQIVDRLPPVVIEPIHHFSPADPEHQTHGVYAREITIPRGAIITGARHLTAHLNVLSKGRLAVWTRESGWKVLESPATFLSQPGTRRVGIALEESVYTTFHGIDETNVETIESLLVVYPPKPQLTGEPTPCLS